MKIKIIVKTKSKTSEILDFDKEKDVYHVNIKSQPIEGKANKEVIKLFHKKFKKPIRIIRGLKSKEKVLEVG
ncbi:MAG: DUF167 domain-containing protein [Nanoarchaeota archaeon]|nr:DUF167 domain-containing protein [Nanoarchaeota archaeon]